MRHAPRAHPGARQAGRGARAARAAAPARGAAPDRARLGDRPAAGARWLGRARRRARPANPRGGRRAQRRARAPRRARPRPRRSARSRARCWRRSADSRAPSRSTRRRRRSRGACRSTRTTSTRAMTPTGRDLLRRGDSRGACAGGVPRAVSRPLDTGQRVVGLVRPRGEPVLRPAGRSAVGRLHHAQRDGRPGGRDRLVARRSRATVRRRSTPTRTRRRTGSPARCWHPRRHAGRTHWASTSWTGRTCARAPIPTRPACRVRPLSVQPRLPGVRLGPRACRERGRNSAARVLAPAPTPLPWDDAFDERAPDSHKRDRAERARRGRGSAGRSLPRVPRARLLLAQADPRARRRGLPRGGTGHARLRAQLGPAGGGGLRRGHAVRRHVRGCSMPWARSRRSSSATTGARTWCGSSPSCTQSACGRWPG